MSVAALQIPTDSNTIEEVLALDIYHTAGDRTPYTYIVKFKPTQQVYYGCRYGKDCHPLELFNPNHKNNYTTSSTFVNELLQDFGYDAFEVQIRKIFDCKEKCIKWENRVLTYFNVSADHRFFNIDSNQEPNKSIQNRIPTKFIYNKNTKKCIRVHIDFPIPMGWERGNPKSKNRIAHNKDTRWVYNIITKECKMIDKNVSLPNGWVENRPKEVHNKQSKTLRSRNLCHITNGVDSVFHPQSEPIPDGWVRGRTYKNKPSGKRKHRYIWITNGLDATQHIADNPIPDGWVRGRKIK